MLLRPVAASPSPHPEFSHHYFLSPCIIFSRVCSVLTLEYVCVQFTAVLGLFIGFNKCGMMFQSLEAVRQCQPAPAHAQSLLSLLRVLRTSDLLALFP